MVMLDEHEGLIWELLDEGKTHKQIADVLGCMRSSVTRWLNATQERKQAHADSRVHASEGLAESALEIADDLAGASKEEIAAAKLQIETRQWLAAVWNRDRYGKDTAAVQINIGSLHLEALRQAGSAAPVLVSPSAPSLSDARLVDPSGIVDVEAVEVPNNAVDAFGLM
jgi:transcriptional regulator with XRE-family HTH domain